MFDLSRPILPVNADDVGPEAEAAARARDAHIETLLIGIFVGSALSSAMMLLGAWVLA